MSILYSKCPSCGAGVSNVTRCSYCGTVINPVGNAETKVKAAEETETKYYNSRSLFQNFILFFLSIILFSLAIVFCFTLILIPLVHLFDLFGWSKNLFTLSRGKNPDQPNERKTFNKKCLAVIIFIICIVISILYWVAVLTGEWDVIGNKNYAIPSAVLFSIILVIPSFVLLQRTLRAAKSEEE